MNKEGILKHREVFNAWLDGAEIQFGGDPWCDVHENNPSWNPYKMYRVKPQPTTVTRWVNVNDDGPDWVLYDTETYADFNARPDRITCVPVEITWTEEEGLDDA